MNKFWKYFFLFAMVVSLNLPADSAVYDAYGHNETIYKKDLSILESNLKRKPDDMVSLERLIKMQYALEMFDDVLKNSEKFLSIKDSAEICYMRIISLASLSKYKNAVDEIDSYIFKYNPGDNERELLYAKRDLYLKYLSAKAYPPVFKPANWGEGKAVLGLDLNDNIIIGYDYNLKKPFAYKIGKDGVDETLVPDLPGGIDFENLLSIQLVSDEVFLSVKSGDDSYIMYSSFTVGKGWSSLTKPGLLNKGSINSFPCLVKEGDALIFISNRDSSGGLDIYYALRDSSKNWVASEKVDYANTKLEEASVFLMADGNTLLFSSNGRFGSGGFDAFQAKLRRYSSVKGESGMFYVEQISNLEGVNSYRNEYFAPVTDVSGKSAFLNYRVSGKQQVYTGNIYIKKTSDAVVSVIADNIYFDTGSAVISEKSYPYLDKLFDFLNKNPEKKILISGFTDTVGGDEYNLKLSEDRASSVADYLVGKGISKSRIETKGFGKSRNLGDNSTEEGRSKNRRVEIKVIE